MSSKFYTNSSCEYFPCHSVEDTGKFNCKFCYCPLYTLGGRCEGNYVYLDNGIKDCSNCLIPHSESAYDYINSRFEELSELAKLNK